MPRLQRLCLSGGQILRMLRSVRAAKCCRGVVAGLLFLLRTEPPPTRELLFAVRKEANDPEEVVTVHTVDNYHNTER